jgi:hypothetical protein
MAKTAKSSSVQSEPLTVYQLKVTLEGGKRQRRTPLQAAGAIEIIGHQKFQLIRHRIQ